ncbi:MAG: hypothetical protein H7332_07650 [Bdellovibrionales bacterium]|nr:hypothetical protein [Ramlibacter sp.]
MTGLLRRMVVLFIVASAINYPWEVLQMPLYTGQGDWLTFARHCLLPSLGDGVILEIIFLCGVIVFGSASWADRPGLTGYAVMLGLGAVISVAVEWGAVHVLDRWSYAPGMPLWPGVDVGLVPVLQMLVLPPIAFALTARWLRQ